MRASKKIERSLHWRTRASFNKYSLRIYHILGTDITARIYIMVNTLITLANKAVS